MATTNAALSLKALLVPSKTVEVEYPGFNGFKINAVFLSRETLVSIRKKATKTAFKNRQPVEELDDKLFLSLYVNACIKGWSGLKLSYLASANFDAFISETVTELSNFTKTSTSN